MKTGKKTLKFVICILLAASCVLFGKTYAQASDGWGSYGDNIQWYYDESDGELKISGTGDMPEGQKAPWSQYNKDVKTCIVEEGITGISESAFMYFEKLTSVTLPTTLKVIHDHAFSVTSLETIEIPNSVEKIGSAAFKECHQLKSIKIPGTVKQIEQYTFANCYKLSSVTLNEGLEGIGLSAFESSDIRKLSIPSTVSDLENRVFADCTNLEFMIIPSTVLTIGNCLFDSCYALKYVDYQSTAPVPDSTFYHCGGLKAVKLAEGVPSIENYAFSADMTDLDIWMPSSVTEIKTLAFHGVSHDVMLYGHTGSYVWDYAGTNSQMSFTDIDTPSGLSAWDAAWKEATTPEKAETEASASEKITPFSVTAKKGSKTIIVKAIPECKITVSMNKKLIKDGKKSVKACTISKSEETTVIQLSKALSKDTKITVKVSKSGYQSRSRMIVVKK